ncbi:hypothetical protein F5Y12DRAFT_720727 [Xylaria sp. FL1777]|nr:hypothetical protein F5Y12DRAFT_720727 [Xylaria sp. FL1777]
MAAKQTLTHSTSGWTSFVNSTIAVPSSLTSASTVSDVSFSSSSSPSPSPSSPTTSIHPASLSPAWFISAVSSYDSTNRYSLISMPSPASSLAAPTMALSSSPVASSLMVESVSGPLLILATISSSSSPISSITSAFISNATTSQLTHYTSPPPSVNDVMISVITRNTASRPISDMPLSLPASSIASIITPDRFISRFTDNKSLSRPISPNATKPPPFDAPTETPVVTVLHSSQPSTSPTNPPIPPFAERATPPNLMVLAIVISAVIFLLLFPIVIWKIAVGRSQRRSHRRQSLHPDTGQGICTRPSLTSETAGSSHSVAATYHSALRGSVRVVIDRSFADGEGRRLPGHPVYHAGSTRPAAKRGGALNPPRWSVADLDESNDVSDTGPGTSGDGLCYYNGRKVGVGRAQ